MNHSYKPFTPVDGVKQIERGNNNGIQFERKANPKLVKEVVVELQRQRLQGAVN